MKNTNVIVLKVVAVCTGVVLLAFLVFVVVTLYQSITYPGPYPYPTIAGEVRNWTDRFIVGVGIYLPFVGLPLIIYIALFIVSCIKIGKAKRVKRSDK